MVREAANVKTEGRSWTGYLLLATAALTCPCHLPLLLAILGGTVLATFLEQHVTWAIVGLGIYFLFSLHMGLKLIGQQKRVHGSRAGEPVASKSKRILAVALGLLLAPSLADLGLAEEIPVKQQVVTLVKRDAVTLEDVTELALAKSPRLQVAERLADEAARGSDVAFGKLFPRVDLFASYLYSGPDSKNATRLGALPGALRMPALAPRIPPDQQFSQNNFAEGIVLTYPIYVGGRLIADLEANRLLSLLTRDGVQQTVDELIFNLSSTFYNILRFQENVKATEASVKALEEAKRNIEARVEVGKLPKVDLFKINTRLAAVSQELIRVKNEVEVSHVLLNTLIGIDPTHRFTLKGPLDYTPKMVELTKSIDQAMALRPELRIAEKEVRIQEQGVRIARAERLPSVNLQTGYMGFESTRGQFFNFDDLTVGVNVSIPIFAGGAIRSRIAQEVAKLGRLQAELDRARLEVSREVNATYLSIIEAEARIKTAETALEEAREALRIEQLKTEVGKGIIEDLLDAQAAELQAETNYFRALADGNIAGIGLRKAIGVIRKR